MTSRVSVSPANGKVIVTVGAALPARELRFSLFDARAERYLGPSGWTETRKIVGTVTSDGGAVSFELSMGLASAIPAGTPLVLVDLYAGIRFPFVWPSLVAENSQSKPAQAAAPAAKAKASPPPSAPSPQASAAPAAARQPDWARHDPADKASETLTPRGAFARSFFAMLMVILIPVAGYVAWNWQALQSDKAAPATMSALPVDDEVAALKRALSAATVANVTLESEIKALRNAIKGLRSGYQTHPGLVNASEGRWAAVARDTLGRVYSAVDRDEASEAREAAVGRCQREGGQECSHWQVWQNTCFAYARGIERSSIYGMGFANSASDAGQTALRKCETANAEQKCKTTIALCASPTLRSIP